jgi:hypothetical protein
MKPAYQRSARWVLRPWPAKELVKLHPTLWEGDTARPAAARRLRERMAHREFVDRRNA